MRVQAVLAACLAAPFIVAAGVSVQSAVPADTLFGQWVHQSGVALAMVVLGFCGQWALPALVALVAGDVFSAEDHLGTWKTVLTRSRSRGEVFTGKLIAVLVWCVVTLALLTAASLGAAAALGLHPVIGLGGQLVPVGQASGWSAAAGCCSSPPMFGFAALASCCRWRAETAWSASGFPSCWACCARCWTLVNLPPSLRISLLSTPFQSWHGLWVPHRVPRPGLARSADQRRVDVVCLTPSWLVFSRRAVRVSA